MKNRRVGAVRSIWFKIAFAAGVSMCIATGAKAQDDEEAEDRIVVTGSRIRQDVLDKRQPVLDLDAEEFNRSGLNAVGDFLQRLPGSGGGLNAKVNSSGNFGNPPDGGGVGAGSSEIDLRFLGSRRVLVLVDGLRWVNGSSASGVPGATDLNTIPSSIIDRIEVLQDGASPIYGSDAIAGVVNIITKREQDGFAASAQVGAYDETDGESQQYEISFGTGNDRTRVFFAAQYVHQNSVNSGDRDISDFPVPTLDACVATCSSATPKGRFVFTDPNTLMDHNLTLRNGFVWSGSNPFYNPAAPGGGTDDFKPFVTADRFNFMPFNYLITPSERLGFFTQLTHEITDDVSFRAKAVFNNRKSVNQAAPIPLFIGPEAGNGNRMDTIGVHVSNPFNPFGFTLDPATNPFFLGRRFFEAGPRHFDQNVDTYYVSGTFEGQFDLADRTWFWDANALWSRNRADQLGQGIVNSLRLQQALGPLAACTAPCTPFNFFGGPGSITQPMLDFVTFTQHDTSEQEIWDLSFNVSGDLFELPAGPLGLAAGFEHRDQSGFFNPDPIVTAGDTADIPAQPTSGGYNVDEVYGEVRVPLLSEMTLFHLLEGSFAVRYSTYSTDVSTTTIKYGGRWQPTDDLTVRGGFTEGFRAASIGELFGTASRFDQVLDDPCSDLLGLAGGTPASAQTRANCATLGVPTNGSYVQFNAQISVVTGGNPALNPEDSEGWNVGFSYQPEWAEKHGLVVEFNYYDTKVVGAIAALDAQLQIDGCVNTLDPVLCAGIVRTGAGTISSFSNRLTNIGGIETNGLDWRFAFEVPDTGIGDFRFESLSGYLLGFTEVTPTSTGFDRTPREGTLRGSPQLAFPEFKTTAIAEWSTGPFRLRGVGRYISSITERCPAALVGLPAADGCSDPTAPVPSNKLGSRFYLDMAASYSPTWLDERLEFTIGVNNLTNTDPPNCFSCQLNGFDPNTYDIPGRFGYVRATWRP